MPRFLFSLFCFLVFSLQQAQAKPHFTFNAAYQKLHQDIMHLRLKSALSNLQELKSQDKENYLWVIMEDNMDFFRLLVEESPKLYKQLSKNRDIRLEILQGGDNTSPYYYYSQAEVCTHWAILKLKLESPLAAAKDLKKAEELLDLNRKLYPEFVENKKLHAILQVLAGAASKEYHWGAQLMGIDASAEAGFELFRELSDYGKKNPKFVYNEEVQIYYALLLLALGSDNESDWKAVNMSYLDYRKSPFAAYILAQMCLETGQSSKGLAILERCASGSEYYELPALDYFRGLCLLYKLDKRANSSFEKYLQNYKGEFFIKDAHLKLAWYYLWQGNAGKSNMHASEALKKGSTFTVRDKEANYELELNIKPHIDILKGRLYFLGGYYEQAYKEFEKVDEKTLKEKYYLVEFAYRKALSLKVMHRYNEALKYFEQAYKEGKSKPWYFACASMYQKGKIWEERNEKGRAKDAYKSALKLKPKLHRELLHRQAQARYDAL